MAVLRPSNIPWIGDIPQEWRIIKLKYASQLKGRIGWQGLTTDEYRAEGPYLVTGTDFDNGVVNWERCQHVSEERYQLDIAIQIKEDDLLITKDGTIGKVAVSKNCPEKVCLNSGVFIIRNTGDFKYNSRFMYYVLQSEELQRWFSITDRGNSTIKHLTQEKFYNFSFAYPAIDEQQAIASYLDDRCSKLDEIITEAEKSIEEYKELKQAVIFEAVTRGLDKNVPMKDSGVEWLPQVPASWDVRRIASVYEESKETGRDDLPILLVSIHTGISDREVNDDERDRKVIRSEDKTVYKVVHKNYLAYNMMRAWQGGFGAATVDGLVSPAYVVAKPKIEINSSYVEHVLRTSNAIEHIRGLSYGVADFRLRLYWPYFKNIKVPLPPIEEQNKIVSYIQDQSNKMDSLISEKQSLIEDLKAYKKSLIYEVVTGKRRIS